jgi:hypothetical protein
VKIATLTGDLQVGNALVNLAIARATRLEDETAIVYARQLEDLDASLVERACVHLANQPREAFGTPLPSVGDIRAKVRDLAREDATTQRARYEALLPAPNDENPATWVECPNCLDAGWVIHHCTGGPMRTCGRLSKGKFVTDEATKRTHYYGACTYAHTYAVKCTCVYLKAQRGR